VGGAVAPSGSSLHQGEGPVVHRAMVRAGNAPYTVPGSQREPQERIECQAFQVLGHAEVEVCPLQGLLGVFSSG